MAEKPNRHERSEPSDGDRRADWPLLPSSEGGWETWQRIIGHVTALSPLHIDRVVSRLPARASLRLRTQVASAIYARDSGPVPPGQALAPVLFWARAVVDEALRLLGHADPRVRARAADVLAAVAHVEFVQRALIEVLEDPDPGVQSWAALALTAVAHEETVQSALLGSLEDPDTSLRGAAAYALSSVAHVEAVQRAFLVRLEDPDRGMRGIAAGALASVADVGVVQRALLGGLEDADPWMRRTAAWALASVAHVERVQRALLGRLEDADPWVCGSAARSLSSVAHVDAVQRALLGRLEDADRWVRGSAARSLASVAHMESVQLALLARLEDPESGVRREAVETLAPAAHVERVQRALLGRSGDPDEDVRWSVIQAVSSAVGDAKSAPLLKRLLRMRSPSAGAALRRGLRRTSPDRWPSAAQGIASSCWRQDLAAPSLGIVGAARLTYALGPALVFKPDSVELPVLDWLAESGRVDRGGPLRRPWVARPKELASQWSTFYEAARREAPDSAAAPREA